MQSGTAVGPGIRRSRCKERTKCMNTQLFSITKASETLTQLSMQFEWLPRMGFVPGSLAKALPDEDGIIFTLCNNNIASYSELMHQTEKQGGKLITVGKLTKNETVYSSVYLIFGQKIQTGVWAFGNPVIAVYDYGIIRVKKLPVAIYRKIKGAYDNRQDKTITSLILRENWLTDYGFAPDAIATATAGNECIKIKLWDEQSEKYSELVKHVRKNGLKLIQVGENCKVPIIGITGAFVESAGFAPNDIFSVDCSQGSLQLQKLNLVGCGLLMT